MPALAAALLGGLLSIVGTLVGRVMLSLGIGIVAYTGVSASLTWLKSNAIAAAGALPAEYLAIIAYMKVGEFISLIFSAILVRLALSGLTSDTVKRFVAK